MFSFDVVAGTVAQRILAARRTEIVDVVRRAYLTHHLGDSVNPSSHFLRFPEKPDARIIALPAQLGGDWDVAGIKWIASFPENITRNVPRASAVLLLNDCRTGYPFACLEASLISAARTAASAVLGAEELVGGRVARKLAVVGCGVIARNILEFFHARHWRIGHVDVFDEVPEFAARLVRHAHEGLGLAAAPAANLATAVDGADVVVLATTAAEPYILEADSFSAGQVVLNISLRDLAPAVVLAAHNVLDDVDHCLTANTSVHLAEQMTGNRDFVDGTLAQVMLDEVRLTPDRSKIFSPFGLGVLDLAVGTLVYEEAVQQGCTVPVGGFFGETERWGS